MKYIGAHIILSVGAIIMGAPLILLLVSATYEGGLGFGTAPAIIPGNGFGANLARLRELISPDLGGPGMGRMFMTSLIAGSGVALLTTALTFFAAYALVFFRLSIGRLIFGATILTLYFPIESRMIPTFEVAASLNLVDTRLGLILPVLPLALGTFIFRQHMAAMPKEYLEAARLDGATPIIYLRDFVLPLSLAPIGAVLIITFLFGWNQYLWPLMISIENRQFTIMRGFSILGSGSGASMVLASLSIIPPLLLVIGFQRLLARMPSMNLR